MGHISNVLSSIITTNRSGMHGWGAKGRLCFHLTCYFWRCNWLLGGIITPGTRKLQGRRPQQAHVALAAMHVLLAMQCLSIRCDTAGQSTYAWLPSSCLSVLGTYGTHLSRLLDRGSSPSSPCASASDCSIYRACLLECKDCSCAFVKKCVRYNKA
jgi:hypothetical protein